MDTTQRLEAITRLTKEAAANSKSEVTPAYIRGFCKVAEDIGVDPVELIKIADWIPNWVKNTVNGVTGAVGGALGTVGGGLKGLVWDSWHPDSEGKTSWYGRIGSGFAEGAKSGWKAGWEVPGVIRNEYGDIARNIGHGAANMGLGFAKGLVNLPGFAAGLTGGTSGLLKGLVYDSWHGDDSWYKNIWNQMKGGYNTMSDFTNNHIGLLGTDIDLAHFNNKIDDWRNTNANAYLAHNNIDPRNASLLDRAALFGFNLAGTSGELLGDVAAFNGAGAALRGAGSALRGAATAARAGTTAARAGTAAARAGTTVARGARAAKRGTRVAKNVAKGTNQVSKWTKFKNGAKTVGKYGYGGGLNVGMAYANTSSDILNRGHAMEGGGGYSPSGFDPYGTTNVSGRIRR